MDGNYSGTELTHDFNLGDNVFYSDFWGLQSGVVVGITLDKVKVRRPNSNVQYWLDPKANELRHMAEGSYHVYSGIHGTERIEVVVNT